MEDKNCTVAEAGTVCRKLYDFLEKSKDDSIDVLSGMITPFPELVKKNEVYDRLTKKDCFDFRSVVVLQQICSVWFTLLIKSTSDRLSGGQFAEVDENLLRRLLYCFILFPERVFALLDALTRFREVATTLCNESFIMISLNKTGEWLNTLSKKKG